MFERAVIYASMACDKEEVAGKAQTNQKWDFR